MSFYNSIGFMNDSQEMCFWLENKEIRKKINSDKERKWYKNNLCQQFIPNETNKKTKLFLWLLNKLKVWNTVKALKQS